MVGERFKTQSRRNEQAEVWWRPALALNVDAIREAKGLCDACRSLHTNGVRVDRSSSTGWTRCTHTTIIKNAQCHVVHMDLRHSTWKFRFEWRRDSVGRAVVPCTNIVQVSLII